MLLKAQQVFRRLTPYRVIADLQLPLENRDGSFFTPHPKFPKVSFKIGSSELIGVDYNNPTPGCNLFDFLEMHLGSYEAALGYLSNRYFCWLRYLASSPTRPRSRNSVPDTGGAS